MPGVIFPIPTDASGAPEANRWQGDQQEPTLAERIAGHEPYPAPPPAYDVENYARYVQWMNNLRLQAVALVAERASVTVTLTGATVGNQRRITVNGTNIDYSDTGGQTVSDVADSFALAINSNVTVTAGASAVFAAANFAGAGTVTIAPLQPGVAGTPTITVAVLAGAGTITAGTITVPDIVIPEEFLTGGTGNIVLGSSADDAGPDNDVRLVLDRITGAFRAGSVSSSQWNTRAAGSIGIGVQAVPVADDAIAIGTGSDATAVADIAIGLNSAANSGGGGNDPATAIGDTALAQGEAALAIGFTASAVQARATAVGEGSTANGLGATALGSDASAEDDNAISIGKTRAMSEGSIAIGYGPEASGQGALATGQQSDLAGPTITASGDGSRAHARTTNTYGAASATTAIGIGSDAFGEGCKATADFSQASGFLAKATNIGEQARASLGNGTLVSGEEGVHQTVKLIAQARTAPSVTRRFRTDAVGATTGATWTPMDDRGYYVKMRLVGKSESTDDCNVYTAEGAVAKDGGTTSAGALLTTTGFAVLDSTGGGFTAPTLVIAASGGDINVDVTNNSILNVRWTLEIVAVQAGINY